MTKRDNVFNWLSCPVVFICTRHGQERDIMTATAMFVSEKEPLLVVSVAEGHLTARLMEASGQFTAAIASESQKKLAIQLGSTRGDKLDKYERFNIPTIADDQADGLVPADSSAWLKCEVESTQNIRGYQVVTGRVKAQANLDRAPLIWQQDSFFKLAPA
jgi:flavin reductase (DIM6/NTAB) family NADH-FMN oxidoreductase RutF